MRLIMGKLWTRIKYTYFRNNQGAPKALVFISAIAIVYIVYSMIRANTNDADNNLVRGTRKPIRTHMTDSEIHMYLQILQDTKPSTCISSPPHHTTTTSVSFILHFRDEQFNTLKLTLASLLRHTPKHLLQEVIVMDDGSKKTYREKAEQYFQEKRFPGVRIKNYRSEVVDGEAATRMKGAALATGNMLVFVRSDVVFNENWAEDVLRHLGNHKKSLVVPHMDNILEGYRFQEVEDNLVTMFTWMLSTVQYKVPEQGTKSKSHRVIMPVMTGRIFAISKSFYQSIGGYDTDFINGEGADLELSLRIWLGGGEIVKLCCSRVAVWNFFTPETITIPKNVQRLAELWFDEYKQNVYKQMEISASKIPEQELLRIRSRKIRLQHSLLNTYKNMSWYLSKVAMGMVAPSAGWQRFGKLSTLLGKCLQQAEKPDTAVKMRVCNPSTYKSTSLFEHTKRKLLIVKKKCLFADTDQSLKLVACNVDAGSTKMKWDFLQNGNIRHEFFALCLEHSKNDENIAMLAECNDSKRQQWTVIKY